MVDKTKIMLSQLQTEVELKSELSLAKIVLKLRHKVHKVPKTPIHVPSEPKPKTKYEKPQDLHGASL